MGTILTPAMRRPVTLDLFDQITAEPWTFDWPDGVFTITFAAVLDPATSEACIVRCESINTNDATLRQQASTALQANRDFLAIAAPTQAQALAQIKALTRQNNGLIRHMLGLLDGTD
jgi:hypothetical protein